jgi:hypothetical protein
MNNNGDERKGMSRYRGLGATLEGCLQRTLHLERPILS